MAAYTVRFESGQGRGSGSIVYSEGTASIYFPFLPRTNRLYLPNAALWREGLPAFVCERREEVLPRVIEHCRRFSWLKLSEAEKKEELGCILFVDKSSSAMKCYGNPENPRYSDFDEAQERFDKSRPVI